MRNYLVIADDFTGANDTGVQIRRRGIAVKVVFRGADVKFGRAGVTFSKADVAGRGSWVLDTESRFLSGADAFQKILSETEKIPFAEFSCVFKKVDSTLRGNIGGETKALAQSYKPELIVFAPALPDLGRTTINRIHCLNGIPLCKTELAGDPKTPVKNDNIQKIMAGAFPKERVTHVALDVLRGGSFTLNEGRVFSFDAETNGDLQTIVRIILASGKRVLWVGSAGLADNLLAVETDMAPALAVVASLSSVTRRQLRFAEKQGISLVKVPLYAILENKIVPEDFVVKAATLLKEKKDVILLSSSAYSKNEFLKTEESARRAGLSSGEMGNYMQDIMGQIAMLVLDSAEISGLFLSGGDTAISCFEKAGASGSEIITEIATGIPLMRLIGGKHDSLRVVTKAGAFGKEDAIFYSLRKLREP